MITYFVSYQHLEGYGNEIATVKHEIREMGDIRAIEENIEKTREIMDVKVLFFQDISPDYPPAPPIPQHQQTMIENSWKQYESREGIMFPEQ